MKKKDAFGKVERDEEGNIIYVTVRKRTRAIKADRYERSGGRASYGLVDVKEYLGPPEASGRGKVQGGSQDELLLREPGDVAFDGTVYSVNEQREYYRRLHERLLRHQGR